MAAGGGPIFIGSEAGCLLHEGGWLTRKNTFAKASGPPKRNGAQQCRGFRTASSGGGPCQRRRPERKSEAQSPRA